MADVILRNARWPDGYDDGEPHSSKPPETQIETLWRNYTLFTVCDIPISQHHSLVVLRYVRQ